MTDSCAQCGYEGNARSTDHRRHHNDYMQRLTGHQERLAKRKDLVEVTDMYVMFDQLIAHAHGGPRPELTPGAQAIITRAALNRQEAP